MKWMIRVDMEGLTGVVDMKQVVPSAEEYQFGQRMLMHDLHAVLDGLLQHEKDEVWLYDIHFFGRNIDVGDLDPCVISICGKPHYTPANGACLDNSFDGLILLGLHAKAGASNALLAHNYEHDICSLKVNGKEVGEIELETLIAGEVGVPLVMVTGDSEGIKEARALLPQVITVSVKESLGSNSAACYSALLTRGKLRQGAKKCAAIAPSIQPFRIDGAVEIDMTFTAGALLDKLRARLSNSLVDSNRFVLKSNSLIDAWHQYLVAKS